MRIDVLDHGYVEFIESWGKGKSDIAEAGIIEAARQSTQGSFRGWEQDRKLLEYLYTSKPPHASPFEFAGMVIEVQAPIFVFREWHRHRTQCLAPNTLIHFDTPRSNRNNRHTLHTQRIDELWRKWQPTVRKDRPNRQENSFWPRSRIQEMLLRNLDEKDKEFTTTYITNVIKGEDKPMITVTTTSGRKLTATKDHKVLTIEGWETLGEAVNRGLLLTLEGTTRNKATSWETPPVDESNEIWVKVYGWEGIYEVSDYGRVRRVGCSPKKLTIGRHGYFITNLNKPGLQVSRTVHSIVLESFTRVKKVNEEVRHKNHNRLDCRLENLEWGYSADNSKDMIGADRTQRLVPTYEEIVTVEKAGILPSYDLTVLGPDHNFVASGFVVHNSYNEMSARYAPLPDINYEPTMDRCHLSSSKNKQAGTIKDADVLTDSACLDWKNHLVYLYSQLEEHYQQGLKIGIPKEVARIILPVGRYSKMRASANLRNWLAFMTLRADPTAQYEIQQFANAVGKILEDQFPQTWELYTRGKL